MQPGVTFANVGQLAIDLIISSLQLPCVGQFETALVLPSAGNGAFDHHSQQVALSLGLFECPVEDGQSVFVLQQRAPAAKGCQKQFAEELVKWASQEKFSQVRLHLPAECVYCGKHALKCCSSALRALTTVTSD